MSGKEYGPKPITTHFGQGFSVCKLCPLAADDGYEVDYNLPVCPEGQIVKCNESLSSRMFKKGRPRKRPVLDLGGNELTIIFRGTGEYND